MENKEELLQYLRTNYFKLGHPLYYAGISKIYSLCKKRLSIKDIENFLQRQEAYTGYKNLIIFYYCFFNHLKFYCTNSVKLTEWFKVSNLNFGMCNMCGFEFPHLTITFFTSSNLNRYYLRQKII